MAPPQRRRPFPEPGPHVPRRGNALTRGFGRLVFRALGWEIEGNLPNLPKCVLVAAPHTSTWDIIVGVAAKVSLGIEVKWLGKHTLHVGPLGWLLTYLGGVPVDRTAPHGVVDQVARRFGESSQFYLGLAPEGTRQRVARWKTGFHYIARAAGVPIVTVALDYRTRTIRVAPPFEPTADIDADVAVLRSRFSSAMACRPERYAD